MVQRSNTRIIHRTNISVDAIKLIPWILHNYLYFRLVKPETSIAEGISKCT